jgi:iron complex transport system substrate-binding protein
MIRGQIYHPREVRANIVVGQLERMVARRKSENRSPKSEVNPKPEIRKKPKKYQPDFCFGLRIFFLPSDFWFLVSGFVLLTSLVGCDKHTPVATTQPAAPTIASLVPAATDLIVGMGARDRLVAVSTYDSVDALPKAGNYDSINWELLRSLHPSVLVTEISPDRQSPGFKSNCSNFRIQPVNITIEKLDDIFSALDQLGDAVKEPQLAAAARQKMRGRLDKLKNQFANEKPIRTLIVIDPAGDAVVGPGTFLDDLLKIAGGVNVVSPAMGHWPTIDREKLLALKPDVILQLLPSATPQEREQARATWKQLLQIPAVAAGRVYPIYDRYALTPGWYVPDLAEQFASDLHPEEPHTR